jgi:hypothetical protein
MYDVPLTIKEKYSQTQRSRRVRLKFMGNIGWWGRSQNIPKYLKNTQHTHKKGAGEVAQVVECQSSKYEP